MQTQKALAQRSRTLRQRTTERVLCSAFAIAGATIVPTTRYSGANRIVKIVSMSRGGKYAKPDKSKEWRKRVLTLSGLGRLARP